MGWRAAVTTEPVLEAASEKKSPHLPGRRLTTDVFLPRREKTGMTPLSYIDSARNPYRAEAHSGEVPRAESPPLFLSPPEASSTDPFLSEPFEPSVIPNLSRQNFLCRPSAACVAPQSSETH